jgi:hypothetical protein
VPLNRIRRLLLTLLMAVLALACGPSKPVAVGPTRPHAQWTGEEAELFDDGIDIGAVAGSNANASPDDEVKAANRAIKGDGVVVAKVVGVSSEPVGEKRRFRLELRVEGNALAGAKIDSPFTLVVEPSAPAFGIVRTQDTQLIGARFVVFYRRYAADDGGDPITHFHLSATDKRVLDAIERAKTKKQVEQG